MKIIQVPANAGYGGMPLHVLALAQGLAERGHDVEVLSMSDGPMVGKFEAAGLSVMVVPSLGQKMSRNPVAALNVGRFVRDAIARSRPDIVHSHGPRANFFTGKALRHDRGTPMVATAHGSFTQFAFGHEGEFGYVRRRVRELEYRCMDRLTGHYAERFVAVSEATRNDLVNRAGIPADKVVVIHNGINEESSDEAKRMSVRRELGCATEEKLVVFVGRLAFHKGVGYLADAAETVIGRLPEARFVVVGEGPMEAELLHRSSEADMKGKFMLTGRRTDAVDIIAAADLFVLPSLSEGLPLTLLEAAMCGKAMVATNVGGVSDVVRDGETGLLVPPSDAVALAAGMERLLAGEKERERMGAAARQLWELEFSLDKMIDRVEITYKNLLKQELKNRIQV